MAEFTGFNGFKVKDEMARNIAKGRNQAVAYSDYATMIETLNAMDNTEFKTGQNIYIGTVGVPDLWVYSVEPIVHNFNYESDEGVVELLNNNVTIQCGYYKLAMLEGQKVDLTTINERLDECFQNVSDGKELLASAITDRRVPTDADATFAEMAEKIMSIVLGSGNAQKAHVLSPYTFTNDDGVEYTGTIPTNKSGTYAATIGKDTTGITVYIPYGFYDNYLNGKAYVYIDPNAMGNATAADVTAGKTFTSASGVKLSGSRPAPASVLTGSQGVSMWGDETKVFPIVFSKEFDKTPTVTFTQANSGNYFGVTTTIRDVTRKGFNIKCVGDDGHSGHGNSFTIHWTAKV